MFGYERRAYRAREARLVAQVKELEREVAALSIQKDPKHSVGVLSKEVYKKKVYSKVGNTTVSSADSSEFISFKLGIQHALRIVEQEVVHE